jgi:hypothetical protein
MIIAARGRSSRTRKLPVDLDAANLLSAERGPSNSVLGDAGATHDLLRDRLTAYRERSMPFSINWPLTAFLRTCWPQPGRS